ncbi:NfeD family protein [Thermococcus sp.]
MALAGRQGVRFFKFIALIADEIVVAVALLILLPAVGINVPLPISGLILIFLLAKDFLIAPYVLRGGLEKAPEVGPEALRGKEAIVVEDLSPEGLVKIDGELWRAECLDGTAKRGERVRVVGVKGTKLLVERRER